MKELHEICVQPNINADIRPSLSDFRESRGTISIILRDSGRVFIRDSLHTYVRSWGGDSNRTFEEAYRDTIEHLKQGVKERPKYDWEPRRR